MRMHAAVPRQGLGKPAFFPSTLAFQCQESGFSLHANTYKGRWPARLRHGCAFAPYQGLGKTAQAIATLAFQRQFLGIRGPHIIIAPLTTLGHWQREVETWAGMVRAPVLGAPE